MLGNGGAVAGIKEVFATPVEDMRCYDSLPRSIRDALKSAPTDFSAQATAELIMRFGTEQALVIMAQVFNRARNEMRAAMEGL